MRWIILGFLLFLSFWAFAVNQQVVIKGSEVKITGNETEIQDEEYEVKGSSGTIGQCIGILCGVTHAN